MPATYRYRGIVGGIIALAILVLVTIGETRSLVVQGPDFTLANHFSYFTTLSNLFAAVVAGWSLLVPLPDGLRGAAVTFMCLTGVVYNLMLRGDGPETLSSTLMHVVVPILMLLWWLADPPRRRIGLGLIGVWMIVPLVYLAYSLARGPLVGDWYPYGFIDPGEGGYWHVTVGALEVLLAFLVIGAIVMVVGNAMRRVALR